jgi:uncharacterized protein YndB with AHSA1/START domain
MSDHNPDSSSSVSAALETAPSTATPPANTEPTAGTRSISCEMRTTAPPEHAFAAWAEPERIAHWFADRAFGDVRPGGVMTWVFEKFGYEIPYPVLEVVPPEKFVLGGQIPGGPTFRLEITIAREGGETVVRLFNSGFRDGAQWDEEYQGVASGWRMSLAILRHYLEAHYGTPKRSVLVLRPATFDYASVLPWFTDEAKLGRWLTRSGAIGAPGDRAELVLQNGATVRGTVLEVTGQEVAVSWDDEDLALELKAFTMGTQRMVAIRATGWGVSESRMQALEADLDAAVDRLAKAIGAETGR